MNDLEHMDRLYLWQKSKRGWRVHILNPGADRTFCQTENGAGKPLDGSGAEVPPGRRLCQNCADLAERVEPNYAEPDIRVLLGEKLAETEPELFTGLVAPEPERTGLTSPRRKRLWKRGKQPRRAHKSKWGKPKRGKAKCPRPFDDPLPW